MGTLNSFYILRFEQFDHGFKNILGEDELDNFSRLGRINNKALIQLTYLITSLIITYCQQSG
jgi:hypothetical protein